MVLVATQVKRRRGTTAENDAFTGAEGEITVDLTKKTLRVHDGSTQGGTELARMSDIGSGIDKAISNCITEIPQDIKLELNAGTLTLKAGSKVYVPNGADVFDEVVIASDVSVSFQSWGSNTRVFIYNRNNNTIEGNILEYTYSGSAEPSANATLVWYDTTNNKVKRKQTNENWTDGWSLPFCICSNVQNTSSSIDQVFNGFGYIGSTVFALPGVKGLIPDGRNADGSLKNTEFITGHVSTVTNASNLTTDLWYSINANGNIANNLIDYWKYDEQKNFWVHGDVLWTDMPFARSYANGGKVENFVSKTAFHTLDYSDTEYIAHQGKPGNRWIDLTIGASGSRYTAPADGWMLFMKSATNSNQWIYMGQHPSSLEACGVAGGSGWCRIYFPVKKGDTFIIAYDAAGVEQYARFIYDQGAQ